MKKILFIINPKSGVDRVKALNRAIEENLDLEKFSFETVYTRHAKHGTQLAQEGIAAGFEIIVAVGGDGSVNDVILGLYGSDAVLGIIPKGSGNGLARSMGIPLNTAKAIRLLNQMAVVAIDLGRADGHLFVSNAGVGFDTVVTQKFARSKRRGLAAYIGIITKYLWRYRVRTWNIEVDGQVFSKEAFMVTVANGIQLGYGFKIAPPADLQDGMLDIVILNKFPRLIASTIALRAFSGSILKSPYVTYLKGKKIKISHPEMALLQLDGEVYPCREEVLIELLPQSLPVIALGYKL
jgi:YegS/Rv2252/BmrU family lipid kinase